MALSEPICSSYLLHCMLFIWIWFCPKHSDAWWVSNQQTLLGLSLYVVRSSLMCAAVNIGSSLLTIVSRGIRPSTRTLMSTLEGSHRRKCYSCKWDCLLFCLYQGYSVYSKCAWRQNTEDGGRLHKIVSFPFQLNTSRMKDFKIQFELGLQNT